MRSRPRARISAGTSYPLYVEFPTSYQTLKAFDFPWSSAYPIVGAGAGVFEAQDDAGALGLGRELADKVDRAVELGALEHLAFAEEDEHQDRRIEALRDVDALADPHRRGGIVLEAIDVEHVDISGVERDAVFLGGRAPRRLNGGILEREGLAVGGAAEGHLHGRESELLRKRDRLRLAGHFEDGVHHTDL